MEVLVNFFLNLLKELKVVLMVLVRVLVGWLLLFGFR